MEDRNLYGRATGLDERGRFSNFGGAIDEALKDLLVEKNEFFDLVADRWASLFPTLLAKPDRYEDGKIVIRVRSAPMLYAVRPKLRMVKAKLAELPGAPKKIDLRLEIGAV